MAAIVIHCSCPDADTAARIARALVDEQLAACVQVLPGMTSTYRWKGAVHVDAEVLLLAKTVRARLDAVSARIAALHPYEVPELLALDVVDGAPGYLTWLEQACADLESTGGPAHTR
ncbi:MAG: divalent-cation tolerance protein CutA [Dokdonella sp.]|uniref:divalent-cation tolerance protein CutA n=1 Tax=Dokdonella sp. TaxID=2291710 RepID=UPI003F7E8650